jgi:dipeptidyl aminopeptidase/acylaminoacyl peptidase
MAYDANPLIPRSVLFGHPDRTNPVLSPDGRRLGFLAPDDGVLNVWVGPLDGAGEWRPVTRDRGRGIAAFGFCQDDRTLVYVQDIDGDENWRVYLLDLETGESCCATPELRVQAQILRHNRWHPTTMLLGLNIDRPELHDVYRLDLTSGGLDLVERNPGFASWIFDSDLAVRGGVTITDEGGAVIALREPGTGRFAPWRAVTPEDVPGTDVLGFTRDGRTLLLLTSGDANAARLLAVDVASGSEQVLAEDPRWDIGAVTLDPDTLEPQAVTFAKDRNEWTWLDPAFGAELTRLRASLDVDGEIAIDRSERTDRVWLVAVMPSDGSLRYYVHDRDTGASQLLFAHKPELDRYRLAPMRPFRFDARDGLDVHGYLTFPPGAEHRRLPAVVAVHGGPWARDTWGYHSEAQWLANRGYVCIQVNYRGSTGYGKAFCSAGDKEWGRRMLDDLVDAVSFCVARGWVDRGRVAIMGASYGGYAALAAAAFTTGVFRCAIDLCGPSNLLTLLETIPPYWKPMIRFMHARVGDPASERDMLWARSPLSQVDAIDIPVLVAHGRNDPRVKQTETDQIVAALAAKALPYEYLLFDDEGHGLVRPENRERFYAGAERFLATHLGGRHEVPASNSSK